ncbi:MAG: class I SAM-dependent methyltransferase [Nannocystis sp.]|uniref:hypothetical protein n=1 Tax=Nannocystis sp. TaxID=1962667 RepID=UPI0024245774|nr:hypothetical protein [Nannocystis sp.]MBK9757710.1 class I SAM-dependent methyltransferase [Nannocystis sp.]
MDTATTVIAELAALVNARMAAWTGGSLATLAGRKGLRDDPGEALTGHLERHREVISAWLKDSGEPHLLRWLRRRNQFVQLDAAAIAELDALARQAREGALAALGEGVGLRAAIAEVAATLRAGLAAFVRTQLGPEPREVRCSEYTPGLQLEVLGLGVAELTAPVLDVGCGPAAALVQWLRSAGLTAEGIDREAPASATLADWLQFDYGVDRWGAVLSHLGFSLHLLHHHLAGRAAAFVHAEVYMQILRSLRVGGVFAYAPGLPFLERMLPRSHYACTRVELAHPALRAAQSDTGLSLGHATQVRRLA